MLSKEEFLQQLVEEVRNQLEKIGKKQAKLRQVKKNNEISLTGITIGDKDERFLPVLYLDSYEKRYEAGETMDTLAKDVIEEYAQYHTGFPISEKEIYDYNYIKNRLFVRVINHEKNKELLKDCPYEVVEDLAVTYRWSAYHNSDGMASALIHNKELEIWGVTKEQLKEDAISNTKEMFPPTIQKIQSVIPISLDEDNIPLYVLSNGDHMNGATAMVYNEVLCDFANKMEQNLYILPSSIHEVILVMEKDGGDVKDLQQIVKEANETIVEPEEILSDSVYYFDRETKDITIAKA